MISLHETKANKECAGFQNSMSNIQAALSFAFSQVGARAVTYRHHCMILQENGGSFNI